LFCQDNGGGSYEVREPVDDEIAEEDGDAHIAGVLDRVSFRFVCFNFFMKNLFH